MLAVPTVHRASNHRAIQQVLEEEVLKGTVLMAVPGSVQLPTDHRATRRAVPVVSM